MPLKAGRVDDFANSMAAEIEAALIEEWGRVKSIPFPTTNPEDRRLLFVAIARGILKYLETNQNAAITSITLKRTGIGTATEEQYDVMAMNISTQL